MIAVVLCLLLVIFMTVEAGHSHSSSQSQQHTPCFWCSIAHVAAVFAGVQQLVSSMLAGKRIAIWDDSGKSRFAIDLDRIRPPPSLNPREQHT